MDNSIGNGPCTLVTIITTLQVSSFAKKKKDILGFTLPYSIYVISHPWCWQKYFTWACKIHATLEEGENLISLQRTRFSILMHWKIKGDQPGIFSMGVWRNFLVLLLTLVYVIFMVTSLTLGKSFIFLLTCSHYKQMNLSTLKSSFLFISLSFTTTPMFVFIKPSSLFSSSKQNHSPYTCMFLQALWLDKCVFHLFGFFGFLSLFIHMQVPCSLKPCIIGC